MSFVTNVILTTAIGDNVKAAERTGAKRIHRDASGGSKHMECEVYLGAFNYLDRDAFARQVGRIKWGLPDEVQLFFKGENEERFSEVPIE